MSARRDLAEAIAHVQALAPTPADPPELALGKLRRCLDAFGDVDPRRLPDGVEIIAVNANGVRAEWIVPPGAALSAPIVHCHGGGLVAGSLRSHRPMLARLALNAARPVLSVNYRLAPEHLFPAAHDDCFEAYAWALEHGPTRNQRGDRITLSGDSIGAALALATCVTARERGLRTPDNILLLCPTLLAYETAARPERASDPWLNNGALAPLAMYAGETPLTEPRLSPLHYNDEALRSLPPVLMQAGAPEFLLPDSLRLSERLTALERRVVLSVWPDMPHTWHHFTDHLPEANAALAEAAFFSRQ